MSYGNYENERGEREIGKEENTTYIIALSNKYMVYHT